MSRNASSTRNATTSARVIGFVSLGVLLLLVGVAFYSSREERATARPSQAAAPSETSGDAASASDAPRAELERIPRVTESLPDLSDVPRDGLVTAKVDEIFLSPQARLLAERFKCVCGCNDILITCSCDRTPGSHDMKKHLQELVSAGKSPAEVERAMVERYGEQVRP